LEGALHAFDDDLFAGFFHDFAVEVFEVFASGALTDEVYILDDVAGKRIAIAPTTLKDKYRRG